jgi:hypothetical protein
LMPSKSVWLRLDCRILSSQPPPGTPTTVARLTQAVPSDDDRTAETSLLSMMKPVLLACLLIQLCIQVLANAEKAIFVAPRHPAPAATDLASLCLPRLSPAQPSLHTQLPVCAVDHELPANRSTVSWYLLDHLTADQRYEVRVCWVATVMIMLPCFPYSL